MVQEINDKPKEPDKTDVWLVRASHTVSILSMFYIVYTHHKRQKQLDEQLDSFKKGGI